MKSSAGPSEALRDALGKIPREELRKLATGLFDQLKGKALKGGATQEEFAAMDMAQKVLKPKRKG